MNSHKNHYKLANLQGDHSVKLRNERKQKLSTPITQYTAGDQSMSDTLNTIKIEGQRPKTRMVSESATSKLGQDLYDTIRKIRGGKSVSRQDLPFVNDYASLKDNFMTPKKHTQLRETKTFERQKESKLE